VIVHEHSRFALCVELRIRRSNAYMIHAMPYILNRKSGIECRHRREVPDLVACRPIRVFELRLIAPSLSARPAPT